jgi:hypothetical protein
MEPVAASLRPGDVARYGDQGYLVLRGYFATLDAQAWSDECDRLWRTESLVHPDNLRTHVLGSEREVDRLDPVLDVSPPLRDIAGDRLRGAVAQLLADEAFLFKDKLIFKPPGARGYRTHQDYAYWHWLPAPPHALVTVMIAIDGGTRLNGAVEFCPGLHHRLLTPEGVPGDVDDTDVETPGEIIETEPGDVVVFHSLTPHRSGINRSGSMRRQLYLSYSAAAYGNLHEVYYGHLHQTLRDAMAPEDRARAHFR